MEWNKLTEESQLQEIKKESLDKPVLIFKHSTRCSISSAAKDRLERNWKNELSSSIKPYYLDLLSYRSISNKIASEFGIEHQSPQVLLIKNKEAIYDASHMSISVDSIARKI